MGRMVARCAISILLGKEVAPAAGVSGMVRAAAVVPAGHATRGPHRERLPWLQSVPMLWLKAFHVVFVVTWFAGLFYLPRLFVYHVAASEREGLARLVVMERRLFLIMTLGALLAVLCGAAMIVSAPWYLTLGWMRAKLLLVAALVGYHGWGYRLLLGLCAHHNSTPERAYRLLHQ